MLLSTKRQNPRKLELTEILFYGLENLIKI